MAIRPASPGAGRNEPTCRAPTDPRHQGTRSHFGKLLLAVSLAAIGCGGGAPQRAPCTHQQHAALRCVANILTSQGSVAGQPGKTIVYVDGVMACVDDAKPG